MKKPGDSDDPRDSVDPFSADDPEAHERERRRAAREAKRRERAGRASLAERVSGALDGAAAKSRDAIEQGKERVVAPKEPPPDAPEPPALRRTAPRAEPDESPRTVPRSEPDDSPRTVIHTETDEFGTQAPVAVRRYSGAPPPAPPDAGPAVPAGVGATPPPPAASPGATIWRRRLLAAGVVVALGLAIVFVIAVLGGGEEEEPASPGPRTLRTSSLTIPEGYTAAEMAGLAEDAGLEGSYEDAVAKATRRFDFEKAGAPSGTDSLEGFLFPATYELEKGAPAADLVEKQLEAFDANLGDVDLSYAKRKNLTIYDVVTIASMIEREVQVPEERALVAAVIYNRLADDEALGIDATLRYEVGFDEPLTESQLESDSPYNTRINPGLPPTPIGNPGLDSLEAAANPKDVDFKYYVFKPGTCGEHSFTADYDEFLALSDEYQAALEAEGGQPSDC